MRLSACRRSRFCTYRTLTVCRCPLVPFQTRCLPSAKGELFHIIEGNMVFRRRHCKEGMADVVIITRELGFDMLSLTMHRELAEHKCTSLRFAPAFIGRLWSLCGFPLQVSRCSEGHRSQPSLSQTGILYVPTRRASMNQMVPAQV